MIVLDIPYEVTPMGRPRVTKYGIFYNKNYTMFRELVGDWARKEQAKQGFALISKSEGIKISAVFYMKTPKSWSKKKTIHAHGKHVLNMQKGDLDNMAKSVFDTLQGICYEDDNQIVNMQLCKVWDKDSAGIKMILRPVNEVA